MSNKILWTFLFVGMLVVSWLWGYGEGAKSTTPTIIHDSVLIYRDSIRIDSIKVENTKIKEKLVYVEKEYSDEVASILSATDSTNYCYFTDYIRNYQRTASSREFDFR